MKTLHLSETLSLPREIAGQTVGIVGIRGGGKTNTAVDMAEELLDQNHPIVVLDPTNAWWGLRSHYPVFIVGGPHGDIPLAETDGKVLAEFVVAEQLPVILSLRHLRKNAQRRFVTDFCEELYHLKGKDEYRSPLTVFLDEAPLFIPQRVLGEVARTVGAVEDLISRGRNSGFGVVLIGQRPATINKDVLSQADTIITHRLTSPHDRKALAEWIEDNATVHEYKSVLSGLATLKTGEAWVWAPSLGVFQQVRMRKRKTFDSSAAPKVGESVKPPKNLHEVDINALKGKLAASIEKAKADDPRELRQKIDELKVKLLEVQGAVQVEPKVIEVPVLTQADRDGLTKLAYDLRDVSGAIQKECDHLAAVLLRLSDPPVTISQAMSTGNNVKVKPAFHNYKQRRDVDLPVMTRHDVRPAAESLSAGQQRIIATICMLRERDIYRTRASIARWLGIHPNGGRYNSELKALKESGYMDEAFNLLPPCPPVLALETGYNALLEALHDEGQRRIVQALHEYDGSTDREALARTLGIHPNGGRFNSNLKWLREMGVIPERGLIHLTEGALR